MHVKTRPLSRRTSFPFTRQKKRSQNRPNCYIPILYLSTLGDLARQEIRSFSSGELEKPWNNGRLGTPHWAYGLPASVPALLVRTNLHAELGHLTPIRLGWAGLYNIAPGARRRHFRRARVGGQKIIHHR